MLGGTAFFYIEILYTPGEIRFSFYLVLLGT